MDDNLTVYEIFARNLSSSGYGMTYEQVLAIVKKLSVSELEDFAYTCYRTAEKQGADAFDCVSLYE